jgi:signal transduction histidine kinase
MVVTAVTVFGVFAYRAAHDSAVTSAHARLRSTIVQINAITELGSMSQVELLRKAAIDPYVLAVLSQPDLGVTDAALAALRPLQGVAAAPNAAVTIELVDREGATRHVIPAGVAPAAAPSAVEMTPAGMVGPLYQQDGAMFFQSAVAVGHGLGGIRVTRRLGTTGSANRRIATNLLGPEAALLIGNQDGGLWADGEPVVFPGQPDAPTRYSRMGTTWLSAALPVKQTPWLYAVEIPESVALAPARALLTPLVIAGLTIALMGVYAGFTLGRRIASPLVDLTAAAEAIARGDKDVQLVATTRQDEVGRLARAFGTMATSVRGELQQSERFATLGRLSGSVSHELRNPLGVMSTVVVMIDNIPDASPTLKEYARLLREQIRLSERIITDLLDRARAGAPVHTLVDVPAMLDDIVARAPVQEHVRVERKDELPLCPVSLDRDRVGQIVWNLVTNAVQAMQGHAHAHRPGVVTVTAATSEGRLRIEVHDTGPGINAEDAERIFEPMYTTKADGVGLGLSISRAFARASGGDLFVSAPGGPGARFVLDLPAA